MSSYRNFVTFYSTQKLMCEKLKNSAGSLTSVLNEGL